MSCEQAGSVRLRFGKRAVSASFRRARALILRRVVRLAATAVVCFGVFGFALGEGSVDARVAPDSLADVESAIEIGNHAYVDALERADAHAYANLFAEDAVSMPAHGPVIRGRPAIESSIARALKAMIVSHGEIRTRETHLQGDVAYEIGTYLLDVTIGGSPQRLQGRYLAVWRKIDDAWKISADVSQPDAPAL